MSGQQVRARGLLDNVAYDVVIADGKVDGSSRVLALLQVASAREQKVALSPTGPVVRVDPADPRSVVALLARVGDVLHVTGLPVDEQRRPGAVS